LRLKATEKLKRYKLAGMHQILEELIKTEGKTLYSAIKRLINSICGNYQVISLLSTTSTTSSSSSKKNVISIYML
jgi:hypothetical protein